MKAAGISELTALSLGVLLWRTSKWYQRQADHLLAPFDITYIQFAALNILADELPGRARNQLQLANRLGINEMSASRLVESMWQKQLIRYYKGPLFDGRAGQLHVSPRSLYYLEKCSPVIAGLDQQLSEELASYGVVAPKLLVAV